MIWTGWNNGEHHSTGAGYGFKVNAVDRDRYFKSAWQTIVVEFPLGTPSTTAEVNIAKKSFWGPKCRELISKAIGRWMLEEGYAPWPHRVPPKFDVEPFGERRFRVKKRAAT